MKLNNLEMTRSYISQTMERIRHAREALSGGNYPYVVRQCQETVELLLKAALRIVGVELRGGMMLVQYSEGNVVSSLDSFRNISMSWRQYQGA